MGQVAVVGAGIAGLSCAYELRKRGLEVQVFEAQGQVGGRMSTRRRDGYDFDIGANFLIQSYRDIRQLARELGVDVISDSPVRHVVYREGHFYPLNLTQLTDIFRLARLSWASRLRLLAFALRLRRSHAHLDFFDLSQIPPELNQGNAYDYCVQRLGQEFADYVLDAFHGCMMFSRAHSSSPAAFLALFHMIADPHCSFGVGHCRGNMLALPQALAERLTVYLDTPVQRLRRRDGGWELESPRGRELFAQVVLAVPAPAARPLLENGPAPALELLENVEYASTVNLSFQISQGALGDYHCFYIPFVESPLISEFTNESHKGVPLVNVGLHDQAARERRDRPEAELYAEVGLELSRLFPPLAGQLQPYDLQRWPQAIPIYSCRLLDLAARFWREHQGEEGLYLCGDSMSSPWTEGACRSGRRVAELIAPS